MKKLLSILLTAAMTLALVAVTPTGATGGKWNGDTASAFAGGTGTKEDPYQISSGAELAYFAEQVNGGNAFLITQQYPAEDIVQYVVLTADIDLDNRPFTSIGYAGGGAGEYFQGCFDGQGHSVTGLNTDGQGFFGATGDWGISSPERDNGKVMNLHVSGTVNNSDAVYVGGLIGRMQGGTLLNCSFTGTVTRAASSGRVWVGGLVGQCEKGTIADCISDTVVTGLDRTGGITGGAEYTSPTVNNCVNKGAVSGTDNVGGIIGRLQGSSDEPNPVVNCGNTGSVTVLDSNAGFYGAAGGIAGFGGGQILNCYNIGEITSATAVDNGSFGGISGESNVIRNCYNAGAVNPTLAAGVSLPSDDIEVGGVCGKAPSLQDGETDWSNYFSNNAFLKDTGINETLSAGVAWGNSGNEWMNEGTAAMTAAQMKAPAFVDSCNAWVADQQDNVFLKWKTGQPYPVHLLKGEVSGGTASVEAGGVTISVSGAGALQDGDILHVTPVEQTDTDYLMISNAFKAIAKSILPFDIRLTRGGQSLSPDGEITVSITLPVDFTNPEVAYISDSGAVTQLSSSLSGGVLSFATNHNSYYVLYEALPALTADAVPKAGEAYTISSVQELNNLGTIVKGKNNCKDVVFYLTQDLVLNEGTLTADANNNVLVDGNKPTTGQLEQWTPIASDQQNPFRGTFEGGGYTISGLYVVGGYHAGLFGVINGGAIKNLNVVNSFVKGQSFVGGIVGVGSNSTITGCSFSGTVIGSSDMVGGIVGGIQTGKVSECRNSGSVTAWIQVGGIAGYIYGEILNCYNTGAVTATGYSDSSASSLCGGIVGYTRKRSYGDKEHGSIRDCYNVGTVSGQTTDPLIGYNSNPTLTFDTNINSYYPDAMTAGSFGTQLTAEQMKENAFVLRLNGINEANGTGAYIGDGGNENGGYPILRIFHDSHVFGDYQISADKATETTVCAYYNCGATDTKAHIHSYGTWSSAGDEGHQRVCSGCTETQQEAHTPNQDDGDCTTPVTCSVCGYEITAAKAHDFGAGWHTDANAHWHICQNEGCSSNRMDESAHTIELINVREATETEKGYTGDKVCRICGYTAETGKETAAKGTTDSSGSDEAENPDTGDNSRMFLWILLMVASCAGIVLSKTIGKKES